MKNKISFPRNFDPDYAIYAMKGLSELVFDYYAEGPGVHRTLPQGQHASLLGIFWLAQRTANELYEYQSVLSEAGINLPTDEQELEVFEIRDDRGIYLVNSH